jgi:hypothetical protein
MKKLNTPLVKHAQSALHLIGFYCNLEYKENPKDLEICLGFFVGNRFVKVFAPKADTLTNPKSVLKKLISHGYVPINNDDTLKQIIKFASVANEPLKYWTTRPGWNDGVYVYPDELRDQQIMYRASPSVRAGNNALLGDIETQQEALKNLQYSSRIVFAVGLAFLAYIISLLGIDHFAAIFYGPSSKGKTFLQQVVASISGNLGRGLVSFSSLDTAFEEFARGANDDCLNIDELGARGLNDKDLSKVMTKIIFTVFNPAEKNRGSIYEQNHKTATFPPILTGTFTYEKPVIFGLPGSALRASQMPAVREGASDIFDHPKAEVMIGSPGLDRANFVRNTLEILRKNQGHLKPAFITAIQNDRLWKPKIKAYVDEFINAAVDKNGSKIANSEVEIRVQNNFAHVNAALMLAIDYKLLPWGKKLVLNSIKSCLLDTLACLPAEKVSGQPVIVLKTQTEALDAFKAAWSDVKCVLFRDARAVKSALLSEADVFRFTAKPKLAQLYLMKPDRLNGLFDDSIRVPLFEYCKANGVFITKRADSLTSQFQLKEISPKREYYYALDAEKITAIVGKDNPAKVLNKRRKRRN